MGKGGGNTSCRTQVGMDAGSASGVTPVLDSGVYRKYPRTPHLPWSPGATEDDIYLNTAKQFEGHQVLVSAKLDGENTTLYRDHIHARSLDSKKHPSRDWVRAMWGQMRYEIPQGWRVVGENMYAAHSIKYDQLPSYFMAFAIYDENNRCLSSAETKEWCELLGLHQPPVLYEGEWDEAAVKACHPRPVFTSTGEAEGYVVRKANGFGYDDFRSSVAKYVRENHVQTDQHWMHAEVTPNGLIVPQGTLEDQG